jgi:LysM repeat protein
MNTPNPLVPQGSLERQTKGKSTVRIAIFTIISIHAVFFAGLLMQGCRRDDGKPNLKTADVSTNQNTLPPIDAGYYPGTQDVAQASPPTTVTNPPPPTAPLPTDNVTLAPPPTLPSEPAADGKPYTIAKGDTLAKIAKANGISVVALSRANPSVDPSKLRPGQKIQIPASTAAPAGAALGFKEPASSESAAAGSAGLYTVKAGESLTRIAKQHGTTVKAIRAANGLKSDRLLVGQKLKLPAGHGNNAPVKTASASKLAAANPAQVNPDSSMSTRVDVH